MSKKEPGEFLQKLFMYINKEETRKQLQVFLLDPLLNHVMERVLPYILLTCVLFVLLLLVAILTLGIIVFQLRKGAGISSTQIEF